MLLSFSLQRIVFVFILFNLPITWCCFHFIDVDNSLLRQNRVLNREISRGIISHHHYHCTRENDGVWDRFEWEWAAMCTFCLWMPLLGANSPHFSGGGLGNAGRSIPSLVVCMVFSKWLETMHWVNIGSEIGSKMPKEISQCAGSLVNLILLAGL